MAERQIHDNRIASYEVDGDRRRIVIHTRCEGSRVPERTDVIFEDVLAYHFEGDNLSSILLGIEEVSVAHLVEVERRMFEEGVEFAWPGAWNVSVQASVDHLQARGARGFEIRSAYGLSGWIFAISYRVEAG